MMDACIPLHPGERIDDLQRGGLRIIQREAGFRFGTDAVLLADFAMAKRGERVCDMGTGTGVLPLLIAARAEDTQFDTFEVQADVADMALRTVRLNGLDGRIAVHMLSVEEADQVIAPLSLDGIVCNPPYGLPGATLHNPSDTLRMARHQEEGGLTAWYRMAYRLLRGKGRFSMVYPAPRMLEAMEGLQQAHLAPKRFRLVYPRVDKPANLVLIEAMKDARPMLHPEPPLIVYQEDGAMTDELKAIYHLA